MVIAIWIVRKYFWGITFWHQRKLPLDATSLSLSLSLRLYTLFICLDVDSAVMGDEIGRRLCNGTYFAFSR